MKDYELFCNPKEEYHGTDFWMLNGKLEDGELIRQLDEMHSQGVRSVIARTYIGLQSDYPGPEFKSSVKVICEKAKELGIKVFLQAGYMPEHVLDLPDKFALNYIHIYKNEKEIPDNEIVLCRHEGITYTSYNSMTFLDLFNEDSVEYYLDQSYNKMWSGFEEYFGNTVTSIWVDEPSYSLHNVPFPRNFDKLFKERWGYEITDNVYKLFVDAGNYRTVRYHFRKLLQDRLEQCYFSMLQGWCKAHGLMASGHLMCEDLMRTQIDRACAVMPYYRYFDIPGMDILMGQMNWRDGTLLPHDAWRYREIVTTTPIQLTSVARQIGSESILCEMYAVTTQNMTFKHQKHMFDYMAMYGINRRSVHGIFYSMHGRCKRTYPPQINYYQPYWKDLNVLYDYVASTSSFVSLGKPESNTLVIHPLDSAYCEYTNAACEHIVGKQASSSALDVRDREFHDLIVSLSLANCSFDLGDERTMEVLGKVNENKLCIGKMSYDTVILPNMLEIQGTTLALLKKFSAHGGKIIVIGNSPILIDGYLSKSDALDGINCIYAKDAIEAERSITNKSFSFKSDFSDKNVYIRKRYDKNKGYYFIFNPDCSSAVDGVLTINGSHRAEIWDGFTKNRIAVKTKISGDKTYIELCIPEGGSIMLYTEEDSHQNTDLQKTNKQYSVIGLSNEWMLEGRNSKNVLLLEFCKYKKGDDAYTEKDYPTLAIQQKLTAENYKGPLTQKFVFNCRETVGQLSLAIEDASEHEIYFNGKLVDNSHDGYYYAKDFQTVCLGEPKVGVNTIEICRNYEPLSKMISSIGSLFQKRTGCELESVYLIGDFKVDTVCEPNRNGCIRISRSFELSRENNTVRGELVTEGYPFYVGAITLKQSLQIDTVDNHATYQLCIKELNACLAHIKVNGKYCGMICCYPYGLSIKDAVKEGSNTLEITLVNTLRNLLGPYHNPKGEIGNLFGGGYVHQDAAWVGGSIDDLEWFENRNHDTALWTDSYMQMPFNVKDPTIIISKEIPSKENEK